jgi:hypothetical protein
MGTWLKIMVAETKKKIKTKRKRSTLTVAEVKHVQVPDADERLQKVFKILMSSFENMENHS